MIILQEVEELITSKEEGEDRCTTCILHLASRAEMKDSIIHKCMRQVQAEISMSTIQDMVEVLRLLDSHTEDTMNN